MIVDDSIEIRNALKDILEIGGHDVVSELGDGLEVLTQFNNCNPDLVLLDLSLPKKSGLSILRDLKKVHPQSKVVMVTAHYDMSAIEDCIKAGALAYISKPFDSDTLLSSVSFALSEE